MQLLHGIPLTDPNYLAARKFFVYLQAERNASAHTLRAYERDLAEFLSFLEKKAKAQVADLADFRQARLWVREFWLELSNRKVMTSTLLRKLAALQSFFRFLMREGKIATNPFDYLTLPKKEKRLPRFLSESETEKFFLSFSSAIQLLSLRDQAWLELLYSGGFRIQEALSLNIEDLDFWSGQVRVLGKGNKERIVPIGESALLAIEKYLRRRADHKHPWDSLRGPLFLNHRGGRLNPGGARKVLQQWVKQSSLKKHITPHIFRHTFATHLLNRGCDLRIVQELLGHKNLATTQIYTHVSLESLKKTYEKSHPRA